VGKTEFGDAFIGYGVIENVYEKGELSEEEQRECETYGWRKALEFKYLVRFEKPLPLKETFLKELKLRGKTLHSLPLTKEHLNSIIGQAEK
jgi:glutamate mutase epsilon subunit